MVAIAARLRPRHRDGWASNSSSCRLWFDMEHAPRARSSARGNRVDEIVEMPAIDDVDAQRAGEARELIGTRIRHHGDGERRLAAVHHARVLQQEAAPAPTELAGDVIDGDVTGRAARIRTGRQHLPARLRGEI